VTLKAVVLWIHVAGGVIWIGSSAGMVVAAIAVAQESDELAALMRRSAGRVNLIAIGCACLMPLTGLLNLENVERARRASINAQFLGVLSVKIGLYVLMVWALWRAIENASALGESAAPVALHARRIARAYGIMAGAGVIALVCGVWLAGIG
jgi:hypothetical protein